MIKKLKLLIQNNTLKEENEHLKVELYELQKKLDNEKNRVIIEKEIMKKLRSLPTAKKRELGLLNVRRITSERKRND